MVLTVLTFIKNIGVFYLLVDAPAQGFTITLIIVTAFDDVLIQV
jgi:hypothetical protein